MTKLMSGLCAGLGILLLAGGFGAYFYKATVEFGVFSLPGHPYRNLATTLMVLGVVLIIAGAFLYSYTSIQMQKAKTPNSI